MVDEPEVPDMRGGNLADRDWYRDVSQNWRPYISDVHKRSPEPGLNMIAAAVPIKADDGKTVAILVLQVNLNSLVVWSENVDSNDHGTVLMMGRRGNLVAHAGFKLQRQSGEISADPAVQKALQGLIGIETSEDPAGDGEQLYANYSVTGYGWVVVVKQSSRIVYAWRDHSPEVSFITYGLILVLDCGLAYTILGILL